MKDLYHYGIKGKSGRYPLGSGDRPYQDYPDKKKKLIKIKDKALDNTQINHGLSFMHNIIHQQNIQNLMNQQILMDQQNLINQQTHQNFMDQQNLINQQNQQNQQNLINQMMFF